MDEHLSDETEVCGCDFLEKHPYQFAKTGTIHMMDPCLPSSHL